MGLPQTRWQSFLGLFLDPFHSVQGSFEYLQVWFFTRKWMTLVTILPIVCVAGAALGLVATGASLSQATLLSQYSALVDAETAASETASATTTTSEAGGDAESAPPSADGASAKMLREEPVSPFAQLLLRRVLQLEKSNVRATYLVAAQLAKQGRLGQARQMMREVAPEKVRGFAPAHAWLAADCLMRRGIANRDQKLALLHDLEVAAGWSGTGPIMLSALSDLLESEGKVGEALAVLTEAAKQAPELNVKLANVAFKYGRKQPMELAAAAARASMEPKVREGNATPMDYASLANLYLLEQKPDEALKVATAGLTKHVDHPALKRLASEALRIKYLQTSKLSGPDTQVNLGLLDAALKADPTNPAVGQEVARLNALGQQASPELESALREQLTNGQATAMTHILLANRLLSDAKLAEAVPHLELALRQAPNAPLIMNNLALALARTQPDQLSRASEMIDRALAIGGNNPELLDSQGEIRMLRGDTVGAISSFEAAIGIDGNRIGSRQHLVTAYQTAGLPEMAQAQKDKIASLESQKEKDAKSEEGASQEVESNKAEGNERIGGNAKSDAPERG